MIEIYGYSDDLIEVEGDIREELSADDEGNYLACSDGTLLRVEYDKHGVWRFNLLWRGSAFIDIARCEDPDDGYSDRVSLTGAVEWIAKADSFLAADRTRLNNKRH